MDFSVKEKILWISLLALPVVLIFSYPNIASRFSINNDLMHPLKALRYGALYVSCTDPFDAYINYKKSTPGEVKCVLDQGENVMAVSFPTPHRSHDRPVWGHRGIYFSFPKSYNIRFSGKRVIIEVVASCNNCSNEIYMAYATLHNGNSGWHKFFFKPGYHVYKFIYKAPP